MRKASYIIYGLVDPRTNELRYVGRSSNGLSRPRSHWENSTALCRRDRCHTWIRSVLKDGLIPEIEVLAEFFWSFGVNDILNVEERFWIASIRSCGATLTNHTDGGDSFPDTRGSKNWMFGKTHPSKGKKLDLSPAQRERRSTRKGIRPNLSAETIAEIARKNTGRKRTAETRLKQREAALNVWAQRKAAK